MVQDRQAEVAGSRQQGGEVGGDFLLVVVLGPGQRCSAVAAVQQSRVGSASDEEPDHGEVSVPGRLVEWRGR